MTELNLEKTNLESLLEWSIRLQKILQDEMDSKRSSGASINKILILMPPSVLEQLYSIIYACSLHEAGRFITEERRKNGCVSLFGSSIISDSSIKKIKIEVLGDIRDARKLTRLHSSKLFVAPLSYKI